MERTIINAFVSLSKSCSFDKITVQMILDEAFISRYTFYRYFPDKYAIAEQIQSELLGKFKTFISNDALKYSDSDKPVIAENKEKEFDTAIYNFVQENKNKIDSIAHIRTESIDFYDRIKKVFENNYKVNMPIKRELDLGAHVYANAIFAMVESYHLVSHIAGNRPKMITDAYIYAFAYALGLRDKTDIETLYDFANRLVRRASKE